MQRRSRLLFAILLGLWFGHALLAVPQLWAQRSKRDQLPQDQQKYDDLMRSARRSEIFGYVAGGLGILIIVAAIPIAIYRDRKKKARKSTLQRDDQADERRDSSAET